MKGFLNLNWANIKSALVYGFMTLAVVFALSVVQSIQAAGTIFGLDWKEIVDKGVVGTMPVLVIAISLLKNILTTDKGKFLGAVTVIPDKE